MQKNYLKIMQAHFPGIDPNELLSSDPTKAFYYLEKYFIINLPKKLRIILIIDYAETIVSNCDIAKMSDDDRYCLVTLTDGAMTRYLRRVMYLQFFLQKIFQTSVQDLSDLLPLLR